jgi:phage terminase Nu1 subunit (DNA packaging protein)
MATQHEIAEDMGLSQPAISNALNSLGLFKREWEAMPLADVRKRLVRHYSELAAGRGGSDQYDLTKERARESRLKGDLLQLQIEEKSGALIPAEGVEREWQALIVACRTELLMAGEKITHAIRALYEVEVDTALIESHIETALRRLAGTEEHPPS